MLRLALAFILALLSLAPACAATVQKFKLDEVRREGNVTVCFDLGDAKDIARAEPGAERDALWRKLWNEQRCGKASGPIVYRTPMYRKQSGDELFTVYQVEINHAQLGPVLLYAVLVDWEHEPKGDPV